MPHRNEELPLSVTSYRLRFNYCGTKTPVSAKLRIAVDKWAFSDVIEHSVANVFEGNPGHVSDSLSETAVPFFVLLC